MGTLIKVLVVLAMLVVGGLELRSWTMERGVADTPFGQVPRSMMTAAEAEWDRGTQSQRADSCRQAEGKTANEVYAYHRARLDLPGAPEHTVWEKDRLSKAFTTVLLRECFG